MAYRKQHFPRKRFFVGCEGQSEQGYAQLLQNFADEIGLHVHIETKILSGCGDPLALVKRAIAEIKLGLQKPKSNYVERFLLFDTDRLNVDHAKDSSMHQLAKVHGLVLVRQNVCFESVLLRHFDGHENDEPATSDDALSRLKKVVPHYRKGMSAIDLEKLIKLADVRKMAKTQLNADFGKMLPALGFR